MKNFLKALLALTLAAAFLLTGCNSSKKTILSDEEALSIVNELAEKADDFRLYMYLMAEEFGADLLDGLETFSQDGFLYAEYHLENLLKHIDNELYYEKFDKETYDFASTQEVYDHIKTFALTADFTYGVEMVFKDKDCKLFYNTQKMSPMFPAVPENFEIQQKTENEVLFSALGILPSGTEKNIAFSIVKNSDGQWRLAETFFSW